MHRFRNDLRDALRRVGDPDVYCVGGPFTPEHLPCLRVSALRPRLVGLPLQKDQAVAIAGLCEQAPFGKGSEAVVDLKVKNCLQLDASQLRVAEEWDHVIQRIAMQSAEKLGVSARVEARPHKLVLYPPGGFFKPHKDTQIEDARFGTLVIQLPCAYGQGSLVIRHRDEAETFDFSEGSRTRFYYTVFYTDCEHELLEVRGGYRLTLVYSLVWTSKTHVPRILHEQSALVQKAANAGREWVDSCSPPFRFCIVLRHQYTEAELSFENLKGRDRAMVALLRESGEYRLKLGLVCLHRHMHKSADEESVKEGIRLVPLINSEEDSEGMDDNVRFVPMEEKDFLSGEYIFNIEEGDPPDEQVFTADWGNEGLSMDRWYYRTLLLVCPAKQTVGYRFSFDNYRKALKSLDRSIAAEAEDRETKLLDALSYASRDISHSSAFIGRFLGLALRLESKKCIRIALNAMTYPSKDIHRRFRLPREKFQVGCDSEERASKIAAVLCRYGWSEFGSLVMEIVRQTPVDSKGRNCCHLLAQKLQETERYGEEVRGIITTTIRKWMMQIEGGNGLEEIGNLVCMFPSCNEAREEFRSLVPNFDDEEAFGAIQGMHRHCRDGKAPASVLALYNELLSAFVTATSRAEWFECSTTEQGKVLNILLNHTSNVDDLVEALVGRILADRSGLGLIDVLQKVKGKATNNEKVKVLVREAFRQLDPEETCSSFETEKIVRVLCRFPSCAEAVQKFKDMIGHLYHESLYRAILGIFREFSDKNVPTPLKEVLCEMVTTFASGTPEFSLASLELRPTTTTDLLGVLLSHDSNNENLIRPVVDAILNTRSRTVFKDAVNLFKCMAYDESNIHMSRITQALAEVDSSSSEAVSPALRSLSAEESSRAEYRAGYRAESATPSEGRTPSEGPPSSDGTSSVERAPDGLLPSQNSYSSEDELHRSPL